MSTCELRPWSARAARTVWGSEAQPCRRPHSSCVGLRSALRAPICTGICSTLISMHAPHLVVSFSSLGATYSGGQGESARRINIVNLGSNQFLCIVNRLKVGENVSSTRSARGTFRPGTLVPGGGGTVARMISAARMVLPSIDSLLSLSRAFSRLRCASLASASVALSSAVGYVQHGKRKASL